MIALAASLARDKTRKSAAQGQLTFFRPLPRRLGTPRGQNLTQVADCDIDCRCKIDLAVSGIIDAIVAEL